MKARLGEEGSMDLVGEWMLESMNADDPNANLKEAIEDMEQAQSLPDFLAERGYDC